MISAKIEVPVGGKKKALALGVLVAGMMGASFVLAASHAHAATTLGGGLAGGFRLGGLGRFGHRVLSFLPSIKIHRPGVPGRLVVNATCVA